MSMSMKEREARSPLDIYVDIADWRTVLNDLDTVALMRQDSVAYKWDFNFVGRPVEDIRLCTQTGERGIYMTTSIYLLSLRGLTIGRILPRE